MAAAGEAYVYAILVDGVPRYIGKGRNDRLRDHLRIARNAAPGNTYQPSRVHRKLAAALQQGATITAKKILVNLTDEDALALERRAIEIAGRENLWNMRRGGSPGMTSEEARERWSRPEFRERQREMARARWRDPAMREKMLARHAEAMAAMPKVELANRSRSYWTRPDYAEKQATSRADPAYKKHLGDRVRATIDSDKREAFGRRVAESWQDPEKRASRLMKKARRDAERFPGTTQHAVLQLIASRDGISTADIKAQIPNARGAIEKLTKKKCITKIGGKYGLFYISERKENGC